MLAKTGLLVVSNPKQIGKILPLVGKHVKSTLYIQLLSALSDSFGSFHPNVFNSWPKYSQTIYGIYSQANISCKHLDVRVLLSGLKYKDISKISTNNLIDLVIFDKSHPKHEIEDFVSSRIATLDAKHDILTLDSGDFVPIEPQKDGKLGKHTVLGGTFDRIHAAHKLLLSEVALRAREKVTVGVTEKSLLSKKTLPELIEDLPIRRKNVEGFLSDICRELHYDIVPISDPFGPSIVDPSMDMLIVSEEVVKTGNKINELRHERNLNPLEIVTINLLDDPNHEPYEEPKVSSSNGRIRLLGTLYRPLSKTLLPPKPYVIGLTGGVASGKSGVAGWLTQMGAELIDCDKLGHQAYIKGTQCYTDVVTEFGNGILDTQGEINRKILGGIVFGDKSKLQKLNEIVWPHIAQQVNTIVRNSQSKVVVVEAAVLLMAGWEKSCHEVWTTLVPKEEAIKRLISRNGLTEEQAKARIDSQPSNQTYVNQANVIFYPFWEVRVTGEQVKKAWDLLQQRLL